MMVNPSRLLFGRIQWSKSKADEAREEKKKFRIILNLAMVIKLALFRSVSRHLGKNYSLHFHKYVHASDALSIASFREAAAAGHSR
jgi:hypothetical protein